MEEKLTDLEDFFLEAFDAQMEPMLGDLDTALGEVVACLGAGLGAWPEEVEKLKAATRDIAHEVCFKT